MLLWQDSRLILVTAEISFFGRYFVSLRARALHTLSCGHFVIKIYFYDKMQMRSQSVQNGPILKGKVF